MRITFFELETINGVSIGGTPFCFGLNEPVSWFGHSSLDPQSSVELQALRMFMLVG